MTARTRLLFVIENAAYGGGEKSFSLLIRGLPAEKFEIFCAALPEGRFYEEVGGRCRFLPLDLRNRFDLANIGRLRAMMNEHRIEVANSQGARADFFCALAARGTGVRVAATVAMPVEGFDVCWPKKAAYKALAAYAARRTAAAITPAADLVKRLGGRYPRVELILNPVDLAEFDPANFDATALLERYGLRGRLVLAALGRLEWQKGYPHLLDALKAALDAEPGLRGRLACLIGGCGSLEGELKRRSEALGLDDTVIFCGEVSGVRDFLGAADIFVMPSLLEGQPLALLEAMAMAKPIIASDIPGIREPVEGGRAAVLVPPADPAALAGAIRKMASDMGAGLALGRQARQLAGRYDLPRFIAAHDVFFRELAGGGKN